MSDQRYGGGMSERERAELHQRIMNLRADQAGLQPSPLRLAYRDGHRDARHAAAELVAALPVVGDTDDYYATMSTEHRPSTDPGAAPVDVIARLTSALQGLMEFAAGALGTAACHGDKCRLAWCESCYDEDDANAAVDRACVAYRQAEAALALAAQQATPPANPTPQGPLTCESCGASDVYRCGCYDRCRCDHDRRSHTPHGICTHVGCACTNGLHGRGTWATPPASPEPPPDDLVALVRALQAHAKEADWQDVDDPIQALLAWEPAASPVPVAPQEKE